MKEKDGENKENTESIDSVDTGLNLTLSNHSKTSLYIFARCDRQKEEWLVFTMNTKICIFFF